MHVVETGPAVGPMGGKPQLHFGEVILDSSCVRMTSTNTFLLGLVLRELPVEGHGLHLGLGTYHALHVRVALRVIGIEFHVGHGGVRPPLNIYQHAVFEKGKIS